MDRSEDLFDVAVVGYGPVGQAMTIALAQQGLKVVVLERWPARYTLPRAVGYDHEVARVLQSLGVAEAIAPHTAALTKYEWRSADGRALKTFHGLDQIAISGWPQGTAFFQPGMEAVLDARVRTFDDVLLLQGWEVTSMREEDGEVRLQASTRTDADERDSVGQVDARTNTFRARYVVGCDGRSSIVRQAIAAANGDGDDGYENLGFTADWLVVDVKPRRAEAWNNHQLQICDPARPTTLVCGGPGRRRAEFMLLPGETKASANNAETAWRLLAPHGWTSDNAELERHAVYTFCGCVARRWRHGRLLLAGDAAHLTPPFAGQGLCAGLRDVAALSWRLQHVLRRHANPDLLDSYGVERANHVRCFIEFAIALGDVICVLDPQVAAARDAELLDPSRNEEDRYPPSRLTASPLLRAGDLHAGALGLQAIVRDGARQGLFDDIVGHGFVLLALDRDAFRDLDAQHWRFIQQLGLRCVTLSPGHVVDVDDRYRAWFADLGARCALVRPDFYLYGVGSAGELVEALQRTGLWPVASPDSDRARERLVREFFLAQQQALLSPAALKARLDADRNAVAIVDVRNPHPALHEHIAGALWLPQRDLAEHCDLLPRDRMLVLVGWDAACGLPASAALTLLDRGFQLKVLSGGVQAWLACGFEMTRGLVSFAAQQAGQPLERRSIA